MIMNILLSSVSSSAILAGGDGGYPTNATLTLEDSAENLKNSSSDWSFSLTTPEAGFYILALYGGTGGSGTSDSGYTSFTVDGGAFLSFIDYQENTTYEVTGFWILEVPSAATYNFVFSQQNQRYRLRAELYSGSTANLVNAYATISTTSGTTVSADEITLGAGDAFLTIIQHRDLANYTITDPVLTADTDIADTLLESSNFYYGVHNTHVTSVTTMTPEITCLNNTTRTQIAVLIVPYLSEIAGNSISVDDIFGHIILGGSNPLSIAVQNARPYVIFGFGGGSAIRVENATPYVIVEP